MIISNAEGDTFPYSFKTTKEGHDFMQLFETGGHDFLSLDYADDILQENSPKEAYMNLLASFENY